MSSSNEQDRVRSLAERIARRLARDENAPAARAEDSEGLSGEVAALRDGLSEIQQRLARIESRIRPGAEAGARAADSMRGSQERTGMSAPAHLATANSGAQTPWLSSTYIPATSHPSQEKFGITEAVSELVDYFEREKTCTVEPGNKPCDHCSMCSSRGF